MKLINPKKVSFNSVLKTYPKKYLASKEKYFLTKANKIFGQWIKAKIKTKDLENLTVIHHRGSGCRGFSIKRKDFVLVPFRGATVIKTCQRMKSKEFDHKKYALKCFKNIQVQKDKINKGKLLPLILTERPLEISVSYGWVEFNNSAVILDGLHRALALMDSKKRPKLIDVFIAVKDHKFQKTTYKRFIN